MRGPVPDSWGSTLREYNTCHNPPGSPEGGRFCSGISVHSTSVPFDAVKGRLFLYHPDSGVLVVGERGSSTDRINATHSGTLAQAREQGLKVPLGAVWIRGQVSTRGAIGFHGRYGADTDEWLDQTIRAVRAINAPQDSQLLVHDWESDRTTALGPFETVGDIPMAHEEPGLKSRLTPELRANPRKMFVGHTSQMVRAMARGYKGLVTRFQYSKDPTVQKHVAWWRDARKAAQEELEWRKAHPVPHPPLLDRGTVWKKDWDR